MKRLIFILILAVSGLIGQTEPQQYSPPANNDYIGDGWDIEVQKTTHAILRASSITIEDTTGRWITIDFSADTIRCSNDFNLDRFAKVFFDLLLETNRQMTEREVRSSYYEMEVKKQQFDIYKDYYESMKQIWGPHELPAQNTTPATN